LYPASEVIIRAESTTRLVHGARVVARSTHTLRSAAGWSTFTPPSTVSRNHPELLGRAETLAGWRSEILDFRREVKG
jgi:hypothetical protein